MVVAVTPGFSSGAIRGPIIGEPVTRIPIIIGGPVTRIPIISDPIYVPIETLQSD